MNCKERTRKHVSHDVVSCCIRAGMPKFEYKGCRLVRKTSAPWAYSNVSYNKRFMEATIVHLSNMSVKAAANRMDQLGVTKVEIYKTPAEKNHRYVA